ncbi:MAG: hypothetical protein ABEI31_06000 [Halodesulfurarchaeum sp.]
MSDSERCDDCGEPVSDALARTVRLSVDRSQIDAQRLCPECFADWINRYEEEMQHQSMNEVVESDDEEDIIVD